MAKKRKNQYDPQTRYSLFDLIAEDMEQRLKGGNDNEDNYAGQTNETSGIGGKGFATGDNQVSQEARLHSEGPEDTGSLGSEQPGGFEAAGSQGQNSLGLDSVQPAGAGDGSALVAGSGEDEPARDERLGDIGDDGDRYRIENYRITSDDNIGSGGAKAKFADNIAAIRLLQKLRQNIAVAATEEEKKILVRYVGWGGLPHAFDSSNQEWTKEYEELQSLLSPEEYAAARRSTQDAHYTPENVIKGIYEALDKLGLSNTREELQVLEPASGIGHFIGLAPENLNANFLAIELDPVSSAIGKYLYPEEIHLNSGFQHTLLKEGFDLAVGNPPFGNQSIFDPNFPELRKQSIHNYFLSKSMSLLREGGIGAFVVSRYFMDGTDAQTRKHIAKSAKFLGAIRLPDNAFSENALTDVTSDIVFFQKDSSPRDQENEDWVFVDRQEMPDVKTGEIKTPFMNNWFARHPEMIIGEMTVKQNQFGDTLTCSPKPGQENLAEEISKRLQALPQNIFTEIHREEEEVSSHDQEFIESAYFRGLKPGAFALEPVTSKIVYKVSSYGHDDYEYLPVRNKGARDRLEGMIFIRDSLRMLLNAEKREDADDDELEALRQNLNAAYDSFVEKYGFLNSQTNRALMRDDPEHTLTESLELNYDRGLTREAAKKAGAPERAPSAEKAAIFSRRVLRPASATRNADNVKDALVISLRETGRPDFQRIGELLQREPENIRDELKQAGLIFLNPQNDVWEIRDKYLSGNVREKLKLAEAKLETDDKFAANVGALREVLPQDIEAVDIGIKFGSTWVPDDVMNDFVKHISNDHFNGSIRYIPALGAWDVSTSIYDYAIEYSIYGIDEYPASRLIEAVLKNRPIKVEVPDGLDDYGNIKKRVDPELTMAAQQKAEEIKQAFLDWVWEDDARRERLTRIYNDRFNTHVAPSYDGSLLELSDASEGIKLRPHQKNAVWRAIQEGGGLFDHVVGAGKTMACIATVMESKRMGLIDKPMIVVPNHLLYQWKDEFYKVYPDANILVAENNDFTKENRERLFGKIATGDWDAVIVAHSSFKKIEMPFEEQKKILDEQVNDIAAALESAKEEYGNRLTIKQLEKQKERMQTKLDAMLALAGEKDKSVDFADLGVDALFVDESQAFKNLGFHTNMNVSGLGNVAGSGKALDLFIKCRYLQNKNNGRGVYFLTGTPISNTIAEVYTLQRYLQYDEMKAKGIQHFDAWASTFGQIADNWELDGTGVNYKLKSRFAKFQNVPELLAMYRTFADVVTKKDLEQQALDAGLPSYTPRVKDGKPFNDVAERSPDQSEYMDEIIYRMENLPQDPREDNPLKITNDARKAGLDFRLINPHADDFEGSKVNLAVERIFDIWKDTKKEKGTQLVFCDLSVPKGSAAPKAVAIAAKGVPDDDNDEAMDAAADMDAIIAMSSSKFSVYDDMKAKLVAKGVPAHEIAFIHDANTDLRKAKLFGDMNSGKCRILIGSTSKMGAGMNVQQRLVAAHHLDAPWRPSDLEQRNGRIIRQGNMFYEKDPENFEVQIYNYATKRTYDARMWQTIEYKAAAIEQFRKGDILQRVIEDVQSEAANAAEMKAAATGNPLILQQVEFAAEMRRLEALYSQHQRTNYRMRDRLKWLENWETRLEKAEKAYQEDISIRDRNTKTGIKDGKESIVLELATEDGVLRAKDTEKIKDKVLDCVKDVTRRFDSNPSLGVYRGFTIGMKRCANGGHDGFRLTLKGSSGDVIQPENCIYYFDDKNISIHGMFQRLDNYLEKGFTAQVNRARTLASREKSELESTLANIGKPFPQMEELAVVRANHAAVIRELKLMQDDPEYVSTWKPETAVRKAAPDDIQEEQQNDMTKMASADAFFDLGHEECESVSPKM